MSASNYTDLSRHIGHEISCVFYGSDKHSENVALECKTCNEVLLDYDNDIDANETCYLCGQFAGFETSPEGECCDKCGEWICADCICWEDFDEAPICKDCCNCKIKKGLTNE